VANTDAATKAYVDAAGGGSACATNYGNLCLNGGGLPFSYNGKTLYIDASPRNTYIIGTGAFESQYGMAWRHCESIGARLPTQNEYWAACSALGGPSGNGETTYKEVIGGAWEWSATPNPANGNFAMLAGTGSCSGSDRNFVTTQLDLYWFRCIR
jgi:hypothetical protein